MALRTVLLSCLLIMTGATAMADVLPRPAPVAGTVVAVRTGEEADFPERPGWRPVEVTQKVKTGDVLRTNAVGQLAILFSDETQIRVGRNTTLVVKDLVPGGDSRFELREGSIWARAARGGTAVTVETPAAAAAIRGTDWTMSVAPDGQTSLVVLEGRVELANDFGRVEVVPGEAASAAIGRAPTKTVVVRPNDREQMLYYVPLRLAFSILPTSPLSLRRQREERARILAVAPAARSLEDRVALAEYAAMFDGRARTQTLIAEARQLKPSSAAAARLGLVEAMMDANRGRYAAAADAFARLSPALDPARREVAAYARYYARTLADPAHPVTPPATAGSPTAAVASAFATGFLKDTRAAIAEVAAAERRWPDDAYLPAVRSQLAMLLDDRAQMKEAFERALALDPLDGSALQARAYYRENYEGDLAGARADILRAIGEEPGASAHWNTLALIETDRDGIREADAAILKAIELDPEDPLGHTNRAFLLLEENRMDEARAEIDRALALDPAFDAAYMALGRWYIQKGDMPAAIEALLKASTANPTISQAVLLLAVAYYQKGELDPSAQALDNADRLDPNDSVTSIVRARIATDAYQAEAAVDAAREGLRRSRARGGYYTTVGADNDAAGSLADALRFAGLDAWADFWGAKAFQRFDFDGYAEAYAAGSATAFADALTYGGKTPEPETAPGDLSLLVQALLADPLAIASPVRRSQLIRAPFFETELTGGYLGAGGRGWTSEATVNAFSGAGIPFSLYADVTAARLDPDRSTVDAYDLSGALILGATPTPYDRMTAFVVGGGNRVPLLGTRSRPTLADETDVKGARGGVTFSHTVGWHNVVNVAVTAEDTRTGVAVFDLPSPPGFLDVDAALRERVLRASANHMIGGESWSLAYGTEAGVARNTVDRTLTLTVPGVGVFQDDAHESLDTRFARLYADLRWDPTPDLTVEAGLGGTFTDADVAADAGGGRERRSELTPRVGVAWSLFDRQWIRASYERTVDLPGSITLEPIGTVGLRPLVAPIADGAVVDTAGARWEAEWTDRIFTAVGYQHQWYEALTIANPGTLETYDIAGGEVDRVAATANLRLGGGFAAFATAAWASSDDGKGNPIPYVPETAARIGLTYVSPLKLRATVAGTYVGPRTGDTAGTRVDGFFTLDASAHYETPDGRFAADLGLYNILDSDFDIAPDTAGWGRTVKGTVSIRF